MQHNGGRGARRGPQSPAPTRRGDCWHECGGPLEAQDERAAGWPGAHAGAQDATSSSWTPGSSGLLAPSPHPSFLFRGYKGQRDLRGQNMHSGKALSHTLTGIQTHQLSNPPHPLPQARTRTMPLAGPPYRESQPTTLQGSLPSLASEVPHNLTPLLPYVLEHLTGLPRWPPSAPTVLSRGALVLHFFVLCTQ